MPRPIIGKLKDIDVKVRIDKDVNAELLDYCKKHKKKRASVIRTAIEIFMRMQRKKEKKC